MYIVFRAKLVKKPPTRPAAETGTLVAPNRSID